MEWVKHCRLLGRGEHLSGQEQARRDNLGVYKGVTSNLWGEEGDCSTVVLSSWRSQVESSVNISAVQTQGKDGPVIRARSGDCEFIPPSSSRSSSSLASPSPQHSWESIKKAKPPHYPPNCSWKLSCRTSASLGGCWMMDRRITRMPGAIPSMENEGKATPSFAFPAELSWAERYWE